MTKIKAQGKGTQQQISKTISSTAAERPPYFLVDELSEISKTIVFMRAALRLEDIFVAKLYCDKIDDNLKKIIGPILDFMMKVDGQLH